MGSEMCIRDRSTNHPPHLLKESTRRTVLKRRQETRRHKTPHRLHQHRTLVQQKHQLPNNPRQAATRRLEAQNNQQQQPLTIVLPLSDSLSTDHPKSGRNHFQIIGSHHRTFTTTYRRGITIPAIMRTSETQRSFTHCLTWTARSASTVLGATMMTPTTKAKFSSNGG